MTSVLYLLVLLAGTALSGLLAVRALAVAGKVLRLLRQLAGVGRGRFDQLSPGPVALRGRIAAIDRVRSPHTGREGVYISSTIERWDDRPDATGIGGKWVCAAHDEQAAPFELTDGQTRALVDPTGAQVLLAAAERRPLEEGYRVQETVLAADEEVIVMGTARHEGGFEPSSAYRGITVRPVVGAGSDGLTIARPRALALKLWLGLGVGLLGLLPLFACIFATLHLLRTTF